VIQVLQARPAHTCLKDHELNGHNSIQLEDQVSHERIHVRSVTLLSSSGCVATKRETIVCPENAG